MKIKEVKKHIFAQLWLSWLVEWVVDPPTIIFNSSCDHDTGVVWSSDYMILEHTTLIILGLKVKRLFTLGKDTQDNHN